MSGESLHSSTCNVNNTKLRGSVIINREKTNGKTRVEVTLCVPAEEKSDKTTKSNGRVR